MFSYNSSYWTSKVPYRKSVLGQKNEIKVPGYWLRNFTKICVTMEFPSNTSKNATSMLFNYAAASLYSALHSAVNKTWTVDLSAITTPTDIDERCLVQGFNLTEPHPWMIKSRIGVASQPRNGCTLPYLVRGVGIGFHGHQEISCGELIIRKPPVEVCPAFCRVYIQ